MKKKIFAAVTALVMSSAIMSGCGNESSDKGSDNNETTTAETTAPAETSETTSETAEQEIDYNEGLKAPVSEEKININDGFTENMYARALFNNGDTSRLAAKLKAAVKLAADKDMEAPEKAKHSTKIAFIGDSITAGSQADSENRYTNVLTQWWDENISYYWESINAGIGATDSYLGVHRVDEEVLKQEPDIIFIEFINDENNEFYKATMDSLVRKCLSAPNDPAVIMIEMTMEDGTCPQEVHSEIGLKYDIPIISYHDAVIPEVEAGNLDWKDISPDNIHPNNAGHRMLGEMLARFLSDTIDNLDNIDTDSVTHFDGSIESPTGDKYHDASLLDSESAEITENEGFENSADPWNFQNNLTCQNGGTATFELEFKNLGLLYYMTTDGKSGIASVSIDGEVVTEINADFTGGWGDYAKNQEIATFDEKGKHTVTVTVPEGKKFGILRWMIS
ncbi:MAG: SGNH/GDSL hydrolase family protein [Ruminococcus sp.]|nr:SGNH/GDSL hydrolase family protein [Ruminococcus sp.]